MTTRRGNTICVSIPGGFFQALQPEMSIGSMACIATFQSLVGFFRPCNNDENPSRNPKSSVSIPGGFFQALQLGCPGIP